MRRYDCLAALAPLVDDQLVVTNLGATANEWYALKPRDGNLYTMGMGLVTPLCVGLATALPHRGVIALDGDGSILLHLGALTLVGTVAPANLRIVIFDNQAYASTGGLPTASAGAADLAGLAVAAGIRQAARVEDVGEFAALARQALGEPGPWVIVAQVTPDTQPTRVKMMDGRENKYRFVRYVEETEDLTILRPSVDRGALPAAE